MAKKKAKVDRPSNPDQEAALIAARERAITNSFPSSDRPEFAAYPQLMWCLAPSWMADPKHKGEGEPKQVLREPLFMLSWDRGSGGYKWVVADRTWGIQTYGAVDQLEGLLAEVERQIVEGEANVKEYVDS